jgi:hypothetical protein
MSQENVEIVRRVYDAFNRRDFAALADVCDPARVERLCVYRRVSLTAHSDATRARRSPRRTALPTACRALLPTLAADWPESPPPPTESPDLDDWVGDFLGDGGVKAISLRANAHLWRDIRCFQ